MGSLKTPSRKQKCVPRPKSFGHSGGCCDSLVRGIYEFRYKDSCDHLGSQQGLFIIRWIGSYAQSSSCKHKGSRRCSVQADVRTPDSLTPSWIIWCLIPYVLCSLARNAYPPTFAHRVETKHWASSPRFNLVHESLDSINNCWAITIYVRHSWGESHF